MKVAQKSLRKPVRPARCATLTLSLDTYRKIDAMRGEETRAAWVQKLIDREEAKRERAWLAATLREQYTPAVCRETLAVNETYPIREK